MTRAENEREDAGNLFGKPVNWVRRKLVYSKTVNNAALKDKCSHYCLKWTRSARMSEFVDKDDSKQSHSTFNHLNLDNFLHQLLTFKEVLLFSGADGEAKECKLG